MGDNNMDVDVWDQAAAAQLDGDQAENPPENPQEAVQIPPAHPQFPQDMIDVNHSSMRLLRATGHDIPFERVFGSGSCDEDSSSSCDATSGPILLNKENLQFVAAQSICLDRLVFDRRALPDGFQLQGPAALFQQPDIQPAAEPIIINKQVLAQAAIPEQSANQITGLEIVPWQPVGSAVALHILADFIDFRQRARRV